jgi:hypothetical protein
MPKTKNSKGEDPLGNALQSRFAEADEGFFSEENDEAPYYSLKNKRTRELKRIADLLPQLEEFREDFRVEVKPTQANGSVEGALQERLQIEQKILEHPGNPFLVDLVAMVLNGDAENLNRLAKAFEAAQPGSFNRQSKARSAAIWTIVACDALYSQGRRAGSVKKRDVLLTALQLQKEYEDRMNFDIGSRKVGKKSVGFMRPDDPWLGSKQTRTIKWERIFGDLGIDLERSRPGRKTNKEREERAKKYTKAKIKIITPSK